MRGSRRKTQGSAVSNHLRTKHSEYGLVERIPLPIPKLEPSRTVCRCTLTLDHFSSRAEFRAHQAICQQP
jgi:hypothetical protein